MFVGRHVDAEALETQPIVALCTWLAPSSVAINAVVEAVDSYLAA